MAALQLTICASGGGWSAQSPGHFTQWTELQYPLKRRLDESQTQSGRVWRKGNILPQPGFEPRTVQPVGSHYINYAIPLLLIVIMTSILQEPTCCSKSSQTFEFLHGSQGKCIPSKCYYLPTKLHSKRQSLSNSVLGRYRCSFNPFVYIVRMHNDL